MASGKFFFVVFVLFLNRVESASLLERSYEYVMGLGKNLAPSLLSVLDCLGEDDVWNCAKERAAKVLNSWDADLDKQRRMWQEAADSEVESSGRAIEELPSKLGKEVEASVTALADVLQNGVARALSRHHHHDDSSIGLTISTGSDKKKKMKKKKTKPPKIHLVQPMMMAMDEKTTRGFKPNAQSWVIGDVSDARGPAETGAVSGAPEAFQQKRAPVSGAPGAFAQERSPVSGAPGAFAQKRAPVSGAPGAFAQKRAPVSDSQGAGLAVSGMRKGRGMFSDLIGVGHKAVDALAEHALESDQIENGVEEKSSVEEQRGKKKKKKKAILKLLILGAVLKAKIGTLLQILSFKLQVKFFLIALIGLGINLARFWIDVKKQHQPPQKVIYYEHAQHQHHYDHEEAEPGWGGPWSRSMEPEETDVEIDLDVNSPYRAQVDRNSQMYSRPLLTRA